MLSESVHWLVPITFEHLRISFYAEEKQGNFEHVKDDVIVDTLRTTFKEQGLMSHKYGSSTLCNLPPLRKHDIIPNK